MNARSTRWWCLMVGALLGLAGCRGAAAEKVSSAVLNTAIAVGVGSAQRSSGGCYASCPPGTTCESATGFCVRLPCRGECRADEECVENALNFQCLPMSLPGGKVTVEPSSQARSQP